MPFLPSHLFSRRGSAGGVDVPTRAEVASLLPSESTVLKFGTDIPMLGGWLADDVANPIEPDAGAEPTLTKIGDFVYASGRLVKPAGVSRTGTFAVIPNEWRPAAGVVLPALMQDLTGYALHLVGLYANARDPENPEDPGSDDSGYGIMYIQDAEGVTAVSNADKAYLFLSTRWRAETLPA